MQENNSKQENQEEKEKQEMYEKMKKVGRAYTVYCMINLFTFGIYCRVLSCAGWLQHDDNLTNGPGFLMDNLAFL